MQAGVIVRGFIASPSDVQEERKRALDVMTKWNAVNSLDREMVVEAVRVETHGESQLGRHPQEIINSTLLEPCDFLIAVFYSRLGTPTEKEVSGTVDEIKTFVEAKGGEMVKLFFSELELPHDHDRDELARLDEFKREMQSQCLYIPFADENEFAEKLRSQLDIVMNKIDKSEAKERLWSERAVLTERDKLMVEKERYDYESGKQTAEAHQQRMERMMDQTYGPRE